MPFLVYKICVRRYNTNPNISYRTSHLLTNSIEFSLLTNNNFKHNSRGFYRRQKPFSVCHIICVCIWWNQKVRTSYYKLFKGKYPRAAYVWLLWAACLFVNIIKPRLRSWPFSNILHMNFRIIQITFGLCERLMHAEAIHSVRRSVFLIYAVLWTSSAWDA